MQKLTVFGLFLLLSLGVLAQEQQPTLVEVEGDANDLVGKRLIYQTKEFLRQSSSFELTTSDVVRIILVLRTMDKDRETPNRATIYNAIWLLDFPDFALSIYLDSTIGYCGSDVVEISAEGIVASTDEIINERSKYINELKIILSED
jgi:hypothetical protein